MHGSAVCVCPRQTWTREAKRGGKDEEEEEENVEDVEDGVGVEGGGGRSDMI